MSLSLKKKIDLRDADISALMDDVRALRNDMAKIAKRVRPGLIDATMETASDMADNLSDRASALYRDASKQAHYATKLATKHGTKTLRVINKQFRDQPAMTVLVAFGIGLLISRLTSSSND